MASPETISLVQKLIAEICETDLESVSPNGKLVGFGLDSVRLLDLIMAVEDALDVEISDSDPELGEVQTVADLAGLIDRRRS